MLRGRTVLVGVSGGIAAYKTCELVRWLRRREAAVVVVMTPAAERFVTPLTFEALSGNPVITSLWDEQKHDLVLPDEARKRTSGKVGHIDLAEAADVVVLAPATADLIARLVHGEAPDALTTIVLASRARAGGLPVHGLRHVAPRGHAGERARAAAPRRDDRGPGERRAGLGARWARAGWPTSRRSARRSSRRPRGARAWRARACWSARGAPRSRSTRCAC